jgi:hypothetical protein
MPIITIPDVTCKYGIIDYTTPKIFDDSGDFASFFLDIRMTPKALRAFEKGINSMENFEEAFMNTNKKSGITINYNGPVTNSPVQTGDSNTAIITAMTTITADVIRGKLKESGVSEQQIMAIETQIAELTAALNKETVDKGKLQDIFLKIKEVGGTLLVSAFAFLSKPEAVEVIRNVINNVKNLIGG